MTEKFIHKKVRGSMVVEVSILMPIILLIVMVFFILIINEFRDSLAIYRIMVDNATNSVDYLNDVDDYVASSDTDSGMLFTENGSTLCVITRLNPDLMELFGLDDNTVFRIDITPMKRAMQAWKQDYYQASFHQ